MSLITSQARNQLKKRVTFTDFYIWELDYEGNHRLYNTQTEKSTIWLKSTDIAVLDDRMVLPEKFKGLDAPVEAILLWQRYPALLIEMDIIK